MNILAHTSFIGNTGYNNHARSFFTALNKYHNVKVRNYTIGSTWREYSRNCHDGEPYMTSELRDMLILQTLHNSDGTISDYPLYEYDGNFKPDVNIILNDVNHHYFYQNYEGYTIGYNVWETTEYPQNFFKEIQKFDEFWVPTKWQKDNLIKQGYPESKISIVTEGVDVDTFKPQTNKKKNEKFTFLLFGRWEYRKSTKEIIQTFANTFHEDEPVRLIISADNPFANDGFNSTEERLKHFGISHKGLEIVHFPSRQDYVEYLQNGDVFVSCARSEGWNLPLIESLSCGAISMYSNWGAQLEFAKGLGIPIKTLHEVSAKNQDASFVGNYVEPDFEDLSKKMRDVYENYKFYKPLSKISYEKIHENFNWDKVAKDASQKLSVYNLKNDLVFVTTGNQQYMTVIEKLVQSLSEFSKYKIIVYGVDCDVPFDYPNLIKKRINPPQHSIYDRWYWKQYACKESLKEAFERFVWIDGDVIVNHNIDEIVKHFDILDNYPLSDIHRQEDFFGFYEHEGQKKAQRFNEILCEEWSVKKKNPIMHICMYIYNKKCDWWFDEILNEYKKVRIEDYQKYFLWNDEGIDNALRWKHNFDKHLPLSNFDTSSYDGDDGQTQNQLRDFYIFWRHNGPYNFNKLYGYQYIPRNKSDVLYFHGNKNQVVSDKMIDYIRLIKKKNFHNSEYFWTDKYELTNLGKIKNVQGGTMEVAEKYGWSYAIYHEIYNLQDYYNERVKRINNGDIVVDLGGNIGVFNRWAYSQGASRVISFEPDKRYFELLSLNCDSRSVLFNSAISEKMGEIELYESSHLGGSNIFVSNTSEVNHYKVRTYTLDYLFASGLIERIDFLKIDIEGAETLAMNGISDDNLLKVKNISMEYHHAHLGFNEETRTQLILRLNRLGFNSYLLFCGNNNQLQLIYFWR